MYQPDEDPFLMHDDGSSVNSGFSGGGRVANNNYQYQPQSMYQLPVGQQQPPQPFPQNYPPNAQPRRLRPKPNLNGTSQVMMPPPQPTLRATPSFYADPMMNQSMMGPPMMGTPMMGSPYAVPAQPYGYIPPVPAMAAPVYVQQQGAGAYGGYRDSGNMLNDQITAMNQYQSSRPSQYSSSQDSSLLIATLVSEQDAMYGTNMLENISPLDLEYIQSLMQRGVPEHEAYRMAFDRKPHAVRPPKPANGETPADKKALEDAIQASLTEASRRASRPDRPAGTDRADEEALEKAIQLSLEESRASTYRPTTQSSGYYAAQTSASHTSSHRAAEEASYTESEYYSDEEERRRGTRNSSSQRPYDRQYPYNLSDERPIETLSRAKPVNQMTEEDYTKARLLREAEEIRARAYGGGNAFNSAARHYDDRDDYSVNSRDSRSVDDRSQYSYDRPDPRYTQSSAAYSSQTTTRYNNSQQHHSARPAPAPAYHSQPHSAAYYPPAPQSPGHYRTVDDDYDSNSGSDEGKEDTDLRQQFTSAKKNSRGSDYTSTSSITAQDESEFSPRYSEPQRPLVARVPSPGAYAAPGPASYRTDSSGHSNNGGMQYSERYQSNGVVTKTLTHHYPAPAPAAAPPPSLPRVPSFIAPNQTRSASPAPPAYPTTFTNATNVHISSSNSVASNGSSTVGSLARVPSFTAGRALPVPPKMNVGIATANPSSAGAAPLTSRSETSEITSTTATTAASATAGATDPSLPQHEWRKTLTRLVSKLTLDDSDEDA